MDADNTSISGSWVLDPTRSDTLEEYLRLIQTPEQLIRLQVAGEQRTESRNVIAMRADRVILHRSTVVNNFTERRHFDAELVKQTESGQMRSIASLLNPGDQSGLVITTVSQKLDQQEVYMIVEARQLVDHGMAHTQVINVHNFATEEQAISRRTWIRVPTTASDLQNVSD